MTSLLTPPLALLAYIGLVALLFAFGRLLAPAIYASTGPYSLRYGTRISRQMA